MQKDVLFYSNYCVYSKQLMVDLNKLNLKDTFVMICVENYKRSIPPNIDRVPTIMTTSGEILCDDDIAMYLDSRISREVDPGTSNHVHDPEDLFSHTNAGFAYLDDDSRGNGGAYGIFGDDQHIETPEEDGNKSNDTTINYERYKASRDADMSVNPPAKLTRIPTAATARGK